MIVCLKNCEGKKNVGKDAINEKEYRCIFVNSDIFFIFAVNE